MLTLIFCVVLQTGTLTQNVMTFLKCTICGVKHGDKMLDNEFETVVATGEKVERQQSSASVTTVSQGGRQWGAEGGSSPQHLLLQ